MMMMIKICIVYHTVHFHGDALAEGASYTAQRSKSAEDANRKIFCQRRRSASKRASKDSSKHMRGSRRNIEDIGLL